MNPVRVGLVGSQFVSTIHAEALKRVSGAELFAVTSPTGDHAEQFALRHGVRHHFRDVRKMIEASELDLVVLGCPNDLHCEYTELAAMAGKHVICEKPLCLNLAEADRMIDACKGCRRAIRSKLGKAMQL
jgi:predicted dehydrogenase